MHQPILSLGIVWSFWVLSSGSRWWLVLALAYTVAVLLGVAWGSVS